MRAFCVNKSAIQKIVHVTECHPRDPKIKVRREGLEPPTHALEGHCSIQLSYRRSEKQMSAHLTRYAAGFQRPMTFHASRRIRYLAVHAFAAQIPAGSGNIPECDRIAARAGNQVGRAFQLLLQSP